MILFSGFSIFAGGAGAVTSICASSSLSIFYISDGPFSTALQNMTKERKARRSIGASWRTVFLLIPLGIILDLFHNGFAFNKRDGEAPTTDCFAASSGNNESHPYWGREW